MSRIGVIIFVLIFLAKKSFGMISCYHFPFELELAILSYQKFDLSLEQRNLFHKKVVKIESQLKQIPKIYSLFIVKSYLYKKILDYNIQIQGQNVIKDKDINRLQKKYNQYMNHYNDFTQWIIEIIINDLRKLSKISEKLSNNPQALKSINNQIKHLIPWFNHFILSDIQKINHLSKKIIESFLEQIIIYLDLFLEFSTVSLSKEKSEDKKEDKVLPYCNYEEQQSESKKVNMINPIEETVDEREKNALHLMDKISL